MSRRELNRLSRMPPCRHCGCMQDWDRPLKKSGAGRSSVCRACRRGQVNPAKRNDRTRKKPSSEPRVYVRRAEQPKQQLAPITMDAVKAAMRTAEGMDITLRQALAVEGLIPVKP